MYLLKIVLAPFTFYTWVFVWVGAEKVRDGEGDEQERKMQGCPPIFESLRFNYSKCSKVIETLLYMWVFAKNLMTSLNHLFSFSF